MTWMGGHEMTRIISWSRRSCSWHFFLQWILPTGRCSFAAMNIIPMLAIFCSQAISLRIFIISVHRPWWALSELACGCISRASLLFLIICPGPNTFISCSLFQMPITQDCNQRVKWKTCQPCKMRYYMPCNPNWHPLMRHPHPNSAQRMCLI